MIPITALLVAQALEEASMPLKPRVKVKAKGIPIGNFDVIRDEAGKALIKPKRKPPPPHAAYAAKNKKRWKAAK
jgi:hypothetical protein